MTNKRMLTRLDDDVINVLTGNYGKETIAIGDMICLAEDGLVDIREVEGQGYVIRANGATRRYNTALEM